MTDMLPLYPFREMEELSNLLARLWGSDRGLPIQRAFQHRWSLPLDVIEMEDAFVIKASIPGIKPEDIDVSFNNNTLTIQCELVEPNLNEDESYHLRERGTGKFERSLRLSTRVNPDLIEAEYAAGVLTLQLPKAEEAKPKRIVAKPAKKSKMIDGKFENIASKN